MADLDKFTPKSVGDFIARTGMRRVSSWSKPISFATGRPVFDARTAVALNCALRIVGDSQLFHMPYSQNAVIKAARKKLIASGRGRHLLGYDDYTDFLESVVKCGLSSSILDAEMVLFANAPEIARRFSSKEGTKLGTVPSESERGCY